LILFPNCKINLGLHIVRKRDDGYHDLETIFYPIALNDAVEVIENFSPNYEPELHCSGLAVDGNVHDNICVRAYNILKKDFPQLPPVKIYLHKVIPLGAGLGGGSSDGAHTLMLLNKKFALGLNQQQLIDYSLMLGSDCPFFIINRPCIAKGRGEIMEEIQLDLSSYHFALVHPGIHVKTAWAFTGIEPAEPSVALTEIIQQPVDSWKNILTNDFEKPVFEKYPELAKIKQDLYDAGATYATMSGSGSTIVGIFKNAPKDLSSLFPRYGLTIL
jgi:4-diphosphocytidyl-2-C-methyl-D-erythritol kinase